MTYESQLRVDKEEAHRAQTKAKAEADRKRKQEAGHRRPVKEQKADEARRRT